MLHIFFLVGHFFRIGLTVRIMFSFEPYSVRKTKQINKACLPIRGCCTALPQWQPATVCACFHLRPACLAAIPSLLVIFNPLLLWSHLGQMEYALKHVFGVKLHSWLASLTSGMRPVRRHQGDSSQEDALTRLCLRLFCEAWSSVYNAVSVAGSHSANSSCGLRRGAARQKDKF